MERLYLILRMFLLLCVVYNVYIYNIIDEDQFYKDLFINYNNEFCVGNDWDFLFNVFMIFYLMVIKEFVEVMSKFFVNGVFLIMW